MCLVVLTSGDLVLLWVVSSSTSSSINMEVLDPLTVPL